MATIKNTFQNGLVLDFAPTATPNTVLTDALNATLITYNGNEMSLQNDMGNGRVETAYLPEGYIPVGSCEFGGIIYIVSYNPLENKSQIGCFPSPERNIESKEISPISVTLSSSDLVDSKKGKVKNGGKVQKILYQNDVSSGDKFILSWEDTNNPGSVSDLKYFTNSGIESNNDYWPKLVNIKIVSIEETGKIVELDQDLKYYSTQDTLNYFIKPGIANSTDNADLDEYRDAVSCNYNVFSSKVSGKLALLIELERIDTFSCGTIVKKNYQGQNKINLSLSWTSKHLDINPSYFVWWTSDGIPSTFDDDTVSIISCNNTYDLGDPTSSYQDYLQKSLKQSIESTYTNIAEVHQLWNNGQPIINNLNKYKITQLGVESELDITDDVIVRHFNKSVIKPLNYIPQAEEQSFTFSIAPAMPYGVLEDLAITLTVDLSAASHLAELTTWKYYNSPTLSTLTWGYNHTDTNKGIKQVTFNFYDNQGLVAMHVSPEYESFNGIFTDQFLLNSNSSYFQIPTSETNDQREDAGMLKYGVVYLVQIIAEVWEYDATGETLSTHNSEDDKIEWRWFWTTSIFNDKYNLVNDFNQEQPVLHIVPKVTLDGTSLEEKTTLYFNSSLNGEASPSKYQTLGAEIKHVGLALPKVISKLEVVRPIGSINPSIPPTLEEGWLLDNQPSNLKMKIDPMLPLELGLNVNYDKLADFNYTLDIQNQQITYDDDFTYEFEKKVSEIESFIDPITADLENYELPPHIRKDLVLGKSRIVSISDTPDLYNSGGYNNYQNWFNLKNLGEATIQASTAYNGGFQLRLQGLNYSKLYADSWSLDSSGMRVQSLISTPSKARANNLIVMPDRKYEPNSYTPSQCVDELTNTGYYNASLVKNTANIQFATSYFLIAGTRYEKSGNGQLEHKVLKFTKVTWEDSWDKGNNEIMEMSDKVPNLFGKNETSINREMDIEDITTVYGEQYGFAPIYYCPYTDWTNQLLMWEKAEGAGRGDDYSLEKISVSNDGSPYSLPNYTSLVGNSLDSGENNQLISKTRLTNLTFYPITLGIMYRNHLIPTADAGLVNVHDMYDKDGKYAVATASHTRDSTYADVLHQYIKYGLPQTLYWSEGFKDNPCSHAQMIASILGQLYTANETIKQYKYSNIVSMGEYTTSWKADLVLSWPELDKSYLTIGGNHINYSEYIDEVKKVAGCSDFESPNVDVTIAKESYTTPFEYNPVYSVDTIMDEYVAMSHARHEVIDFTNNSKVVRVNTDISRGVLYTLEENELVEFNDSSVFQLLTAFTESEGHISATKTSDIVRHKIPKKSVSLRGNALQIDVNQLNRHDQYYRLYFQGDDEALKLSINHMPKINLFDYTTICQ